MKRICIILCILLTLTACKGNKKSNKVIAIDTNMIKQKAFVAGFKCSLQNRVAADYIGADTLVISKSLLSLMLGNYDLYKVNGDKVKIIVDLK